MKAGTFIFWSVALLAGAIAIRGEHVPLGVLLRDETSTDAFTIANESKEPQLVVQAESSCDCLVVDGLPLELAPGETKSVAFHYRSRNTGAFALEVRLLGADGTTVVDRHTVSGFVADRAWLLAPDAARALAKPGGVMFVDVRASSKFATAHIPRAINLPAFALKTRPAWRAHSLVLVDEGFAPEALLALVAELRGRGFSDVRVLAGGLPAWIRDGGAVEGTSTSSLVAARVTAAEFARAAAHAEWRVFAIESANESRPALPGIVTVAVPEELARLLAGDTAERTGRLLPRVLVIADTDSTMAQLETLTRAQAQAQVYFLEGGRPALDRFLQQQLALASNDRPLLFVRSRHSVRPSGGCAPCAR